MAAPPAAAARRSRSRPYRPSCCRRRTRVPRSSHIWWPYKFVDGIPIYRTCGQLERLGLDLSPSTAGTNPPRIRRRGLTACIPKGGSGSQVKHRKRLVGAVETAAALGRQRPMKVRGALRQYLQFELTEMERARSVVDCLVAAMRDGRADSQDPHYPDVARVASRMMSKSIVNMNNLLLDDHLAAFSEAGF